MKNNLAKILEVKMKRSGLKMTKRLSSVGLFSSDVYDTRYASSIRQVYKMADEGFSISEDVGLFIFNAILQNEK
jgi:hypothetical protein